MAGAFAGESNPAVAPLDVAAGGADEDQFATQMTQLLSLGFSDIEQNRNALEATGGALEQAIELLIVMRESMES